MIPFDLEYYVPADVSEAYDWFRKLQEQGKDPVYYSGGTEILTFARLNRVRTGAVIDLKAIPDCRSLQMSGQLLEIGSCVSLSDLCAANPFPLLSLAARGVADQTSRNKITFGGNICGRIIYREAVLPLLLTDSAVVLAGENGMRAVSIHEVFEGRLKLRKGEFLVKTLTDIRFLPLPYYHEKRRKIGHVGYPIVTVAALKKDGKLRMAFSGVCAFPFRSDPMEQVLNDSSIPPHKRIEEAIGRLPGPVLDDIESSAPYRRFLLARTMADAIQSLESR
ncbi:xanthine dehydrogenase family protein subunit M [Cohnella sp. AR92]|uniref:FAD binding domain-containing protein n=1 Tax=Cohnella sp. AR92 TaxID=648716 RepID=UPI000F8E6DFE|nr:FAD binding domain-containing protein [Cohnella sp. AR92]RUS46899.1 xanthine dehydrogenase [Cohnella sp. AR92]